MNDFLFTTSEKKQISTLVKKIRCSESDIKSSVIFSFEDLKEVLSEPEFMVLKRIQSIKPKKYGFRGPFYGTPSVPKDLIQLNEQAYSKDGKKIIISPPVMLPQKTHKSFINMLKLMENDIGDMVLVESGYRSPAYQLFLFAEYLYRNEFNLKKTIQQVALPGYSEHGYPKRQALDFITKKGIPDDNNPQLFAETKEYEWLEKKAVQFNFELSYPKENSFGIAYEPWHWAYVDMSIK